MRKYHSPRPLCSVQLLITGHRSRTLDYLSGGTSNDLLSRVAYFCKTLWLFNLSDLKTIVMPNTIFGVIHALVAHKFGITPAAGPDIILRLPLVLLWVWTNLLLLSINNQRSPSAIAEDAVNKPWRPLPQGRISPGESKRLLYWTYAITPLISTLAGGGLRQNFGLIFLGAWYNEFGGSDSNPLVRNAIVAIGYFCFTSGAMEVSLGFELPMPLKGTPGSDGAMALFQWLGIIVGAIVTTMHTQDMYDQEGDALRGRRTLPLVVGDGCARWITMFWMFVWGIICPLFWGLSPLSGKFLLSFGPAVTVGVRGLIYRSVSSDKITFWVWNVWISCLFALPVFC